MKLALGLQCLLLAYHQFTTWVDLYPFNGVRFTKPSERRIEAAVNLTLMSLPIAGFAARIEPLIYYGVAYYFILFAIECATWWLPYFVGASPGWSEVYQRVHSTTWGILPGHQRRPAPNVEHLILMSITVAAALATARAFRAAHPAGYPHAWIAVALGTLLFAAVCVQQTGRRSSSMVQPSEGAPQ